MSIDPLCVAVEGIGFGPLSMATMGFVSVELEIIITPPGDLHILKGKKAEGLRITFNIQFRGEVFRKSYLLPDTIGSVAAKLLSHRRSNALKLVTVEATKI